MYKTDLDMPPQKDEDYFLAVLQDVPMAHGDCLHIPVGSIVNVEYADGWDYVVLHYVHDDEVYEFSVDADDLRVFDHNVGGVVFGKDIVNVVEYRGYNEAMRLGTGRAELIKGVLVVSYKRQGWRAEFWLGDERNIVSGYPSRNDTLTTARQIIAKSDEEHM